MEEARKNRRFTLTELKAMVEAFAESFDPEEVKRSARSTWNRARAFRVVASASFEGILTKILTGPEYSKIKMSRKD